MKIYSIIIDETDSVPYLYEKSFKDYYKAEETLIRLGEEYANEHGGEFSVSDFAVFHGGSDLVDYYIETSEI